MEKTQKIEENKMKWTSFWDMHSGGGRKTEYNHIYIEAPKTKAIAIFEEELKYDPTGMTCPTCGPDFNIEEYETLEEATLYERKPWRSKTETPLNEWLENNKNDVLVIYVIK